MAFQNFVDIGGGLAPVGSPGDLRVSRNPFGLTTSLDGAPFVSLPVNQDYWLSYWSQSLLQKTGADPRLWHCTAKSDFTGPSGVDYQQLLGAAGSLNSVVVGPGVRNFQTTAGAGVFAGWASIGNSAPAVTGVPATLDGWAIENARLKKWGIVFRFKLPTVADGNTDIVLGIRTSTGLIIGFGNVPALNPTNLIPIKGGASTPNVQGDSTSTKVADPNNFVWGILYNDQANIKYGIDIRDGEPDLVVCPSVTATSGGAYAYGINFPLGGGAVESLFMDKFAVFTET